LTEIQNVLQALLKSCEKRTAKSILLSKTTCKLVLFVSIQYRDRFYLLKSGPSWVIGTSTKYHLLSKCKISERYCLHNI